MSDEPTTSNVWVTHELNWLWPEFECKWTSTEKDDKLYTLAKRYHDETETFDRTVCTGPIIYGSIQPASMHEMAKITHNAHKVWRQIRADAANHGITGSELWRAIGKYA